MRKIMISSIVVALIGLSCTKEKLTMLDPNLGRFETSENQAQLKERLTIFNTPVYFQGKNAAASFTHVATVSPPNVNGKTVGATSVSKNGNYVYVSYNTTGADYGGSIDVIDVSNPSSPVLVSQLIAIDTDFHDLEIENKYLFYGGQRDLASSAYPDSTGHAGAVAGRFELSGGILTAINNEEPFKGFAINSITRHGGEFHMVSGNRNGGIITAKWGFDIDTAAKSQVDFDGGQFLAIQGSEIVVLQGEPGKQTILHYYDYHTTQPGDAAQFPLPYEITDLDRNGIDIYKGKAYIAMGEDGLIEVDLQNGNHKQFYYSTTDVAKGVAVSKDYVFVANGNDGLVIADRKNNKLPTIGAYDISEDANDVVYDPSGWVFIAQGNGGLRILKEEDL